MRNGYKKYKKTNRYIKDHEITSNILKEYHKTHPYKKHTIEAKLKMSLKKKGRKFKNNFMINKRWIHNDSLKKNMLISKDLDIPHGWENGRKMSFKTITNI